jgi:HSP20 family molecular chaperone IbpA
MSENLSLFNNPLMLGFDSLERMIDRAAKASQDNYPPYDIEQISDKKTCITLAVAGFDEEDLDITLQNRQLIIKGKLKACEENKNKKFVYRGIATRQFQRVFMLAEGIEIKEASLSKGLLKIMLERNEPEVKIEKIGINNMDKKNKKNASEK